MSLISLMTRYGESRMAGLFRRILDDLRMLSPARPGRPRVEDGSGYVKTEWRDTLLRSLP